MTPQVKYDLISKYEVYGTEWTKLKFLQNNKKGKCLLKFLSAPSLNLLQTHQCHMHTKITASLIKYLNKEWICQMFSIQHAVILLLSQK